MQKKYERKLPPMAVFKTGKHRWEKMVLLMTARPRALKLEHGLIDCQFHASYRLLGLDFFLFLFLNGAEKFNFIFYFIYFY